MDMDYPVDMPEVLDIVATAEVVIVRFSTVARRLLLDFRASTSERPMLRLVRRARSPEERFRDLRRLRPGLELPEQIMTFHWPKDVASFERLGVLARIVDKVRNTGYPDMEQQCRQVYGELLALERAELLAAITGEGYQALWERERS